MIIHEEKQQTVAGSQIPVLEATALAANTNLHRRQHKFQQRCETATIQGTHKLPATS